MSEQKLKQPNLNQVLQSQKLLTEFTSLMGVLNMLHNRIMAANLIVPPKPTAFTMRNPSGRHPHANWMEESMRQMEESVRGMNWPIAPNMGMEHGLFPGSPAANMYAQSMIQPNILTIISQIFQLAPEMITFEKMEELKTDVEELQRKILDMISAAVITEPNAE